MIEAYIKLYHLGYATSVEVWGTSILESNKIVKKLVGGLYGVTQCKAFFEESMFF